MHVYRTTNEVLMLNPKADRQAKRAQEDRRVDDDETEMRESLIAFMQSPASKNFNFRKFTTRELMTGVNAPWGHWATQGRGYLLNIAAHVLTRLGFEKYPGQRTPILAGDQETQGDVRVTSLEVTSP